MELYNRLIENPLFFKWIYHPTQEIESYWKQYLEANSKEAQAILDFKAQFEKHLQYKNETLSELEKKALAKKIIKQLEEADRQRNRFAFMRVALRYAAVAVIFLSIGGGAVYYYMHEDNIQYAMESFTVTQNIQEPVLILDNEEQIPLNNEESELEYSVDGAIRINQKELVGNNIDATAPKMNTLVIPYGNRSTINLSDGTKVWLNAGSRLIYPSKFVDKTREVYLVGEAFFDVEKNADQPFVVKTSTLSVKVLGTKFNVSAYPEDNTIQTVLTEGSVEIIESRTGLFNTGVVLKPGQLALWSKSTESTKVYTVDTDYYTLWTEGIFSFSNTDLNRIIKKLERYYNIRFDYVDPLDGTIKISGKLDVATNQDEVFEYLEVLTGLDFIKINEWKYLVK
ncbi:FecR domain-containing protein [uncultured Draconibacterium sp.]|uniref:FecR family protein n=1 Tax=uncultured Draconibacterium sp. TaxID=1573823 RepID=UPI0025F3112C|nr:FecR domain-containing protein [uncultured Draconibacterium sp.]